jgi:hypothetical protein
VFNLALAVVGGVFFGVSVYVLPVDSCACGGLPTNKYKNESNHPNHPKHPFQTLAETSVVADTRQSSDVLLPGFPDESKKVVGNR